LGSDTECNDFLDKFWDTFPLEKGNAAFSGPNFDLNQKLSEELAHGYYHWYGSLTTPPCTEGVSWNLLKVHEKVCQRQLDKLKSALGTTQSGVDFNNRVTQPLNHRVVTETDKESDDTEDDMDVDSAVGPAIVCAMMSLVLALDLATIF